MKRSSADFGLYYVFYCYLQGADQGTARVLPSLAATGDQGIARVSPSLASVRPPVSRVGGMVNRSSSDLGLYSQATLSSKHLEDSLAIDGSSKKLED